MVKIVKQYFNDTRAVIDDEELQMYKNGNNTSSRDSNKSRETLPYKCFFKYVLSSRNLFIDALVHDYFNFSDIYYKFQALYLFF